MRRNRFQRILLVPDTMFTDPRLSTPIVDGLTFAGNIIQTDADADRVASAQRLNGSTAQRLNGSTAQRLNGSTAQRQGSITAATGAVIEESASR